MSGFKLGNGLKRPTAGKPAPTKKATALFGGNDSDSDDRPQQSKAKDDPTNPQAITELGDLDFSGPPPPSEPSRKAGRKAKSALPTGPPPSLKNKQKALDAAAATRGDLSSALTSRKYQEAAESADKNIYDYDAVYDSLQPAAAASAASAADAEAETRPRYMTSIVAAAAVRKRDALAAEQVKIERDREAEGDEFADKEVFETAAYKRQKAEKKELDAELQRVEQEEARKRAAGGGGGMTDFYKKLLREKEEERAAVMRAAEARSKMTPEERAAEDRRRAQEQEVTEAERVREVIARGGTVAINEDGQVVDKRQLLQGGLNVLPSAVRKKETERKRERAPELGPGAGVGAGAGAGGRRAVRERQSKMMEEQLAASLKRAREEEEKEREKIEMMNKSRKTEADISSAKERYLARKRAAEEAKKKT
ncbi:hypothetical protein TD95_002327 [Thielaviopsis punctulata]|uniref:Nuclear speckle splicing regulatory protein 1 N-terminal domain-containing protein n=1 Tax=Thielaviopsis punctulata TaxID=72032 RepID=A0A0F4ZD91_9PEZI|nr:hypothetical protein TD95_002327 [Thielaviopsis punctulata]